MTFYSEGKIWLRKKQVYFRYAKNIVYLFPLLFIYVIHEHIMLKNHIIHSYTEQNMKVTLHYYKLLTLSCKTNYQQFRVSYSVSLASLVAQLVKNLPAMQASPVQFLGQEDPLQKGQATQSSILGLCW